MTPITWPCMSCWPGHLGGVPFLYCAYRDWAATPIARLAKKDQELAELAALAERHAAAVVELTQRLAVLEAQLNEAPPPQIAPSDGKIPCDYPGCDARLKSRVLLNHKRLAHGTKLAAPVPLALAPSRPIIQFVEDLGWHCAAKGCAGAHARDLHDPLFCTLHAQRQIANGVEVTL